METLLTEIIGFYGLRREFRLARRDRSYLQYFSTLRVLKTLGRIASTIMYPRLWQRCSVELIRTGKESI
jgi:hypothetical protein